ncbi:hypothetical protein I5907_17845 [Panacibacter sp. DH6]|uniref:Uncharacterized protein n=1 Tax=Panacibacter microcysteis TaxID=2793269 RepID=A0A931GZ94_9BACT|nr:hypothetical protein [Panacibacter microcysteis]MBG9378105.1 hypothetical protein [Panacibacter microcysteis]
MVIKIINQGQELSGRVIYNFNIITDMILVRFDRCFGETERDVVLLKLKNTQTWFEEDNLSLRYPEITGQLQYKLRNVFLEASRCDDSL